ncbi:hypothetical protein ACFQ7O_26345 [Streptomyces sp. NPDC056485]|uniref:WD40 repeat domain-containing protein n=1 Tax=Streptomyces sp. NPDC056485 TaxID=3345834 RepID=UPI003682B805
MGDTEPQPRAAFEEGLAALAGELTRLRIGRGRPSYRDLEARAAGSGTGLRLPVATQSDAFSGKRLVRSDTFMALVRILLSYDEYGRPTAIPAHTAPELAVWRRRWQDLAALQPPGHSRARTARAARAAAASGEAVHETSRDAPTGPREPAGPHEPASPREPAAPRDPVRIEGPFGLFASHAHAHTDPADPAEAPRTSRHPEPATGPTAEPARGPAPDAGRTPPPDAGRAPYALRHRLTGHLAPVRDVAFSPDGRLLASAGGDTVQLWDTATGVGTITPFTATHPLAFTPGGQLLAADARDPSVLHRIEPATGRPEGPPLTGHASPVTDITCSPTGGMAATLERGGTVRLCDLSAGGLPFVLTHGGAADPIDAVAFARDGRLLAAARSSRVWDLLDRGAAGAPRAADGGTPEAVALSPDGQLLALGHRDGRTSLHEAAGGRDELTLPGHAGPVRALAFSPDGRLLATGSDDATVRLWDTATGLPVGPPLSDHAGRIEDIAFSATGRLLATASSDETALLYERSGTGPGPGRTTPLAATALGVALRDRQPVRLPPVQAGAALVRVAFSPDAGMIAATTVTEVVRLWSPVTRRPLRAGAAEARALPGCLAFTPDGALLATAHTGGVVRLTGPATGAVRREVQTEHTGALTRLACSPEGRLLATADADGTVEFRDLATGRQFGDPLAAHQGKVVALAFAPYGQVLATSGADGTVLVWHAGHPHRLEAPLMVHRAVAFSPDGRILATGCEDRTVRLWDPRSGLQRGGPLIGHTAPVTDLAFSPGGDLLASACGDGTTLLWDPATGQRAGGSLPGHEGAVNAVAFSPDGSLLVTAGQDGALHRWVLGPL